MLASGVEESGVSGKFQIKAKRDTKMTDVWTIFRKPWICLNLNTGIVRINRSAGIIYMADRPGKVASMGPVSGLPDGRASPPGVY